MHIDERGALKEVPLMPPLDGESFEDRMRRSGHAEEARELVELTGKVYGALGRAVVAWADAVEDEAINGDAAAKQQELDRYERDRYRDMRRRGGKRLTLGHAGASHHPRRRVLRSATSGKWS